MSQAGTGPVPMRSVSAAAAEGVKYGKVTVEMMIPPMSSGLSPAEAIASSAASSHISRTPTSLLARLRVTMPVRGRIHSSEELIGPAMSSLVTGFSAR